MHISDKTVNRISLSLAIAASILLFLDVTPFYASNYNYWGYSEWQINYEGGWIRRGLFGQLLYQTVENQVQGFNILVFIMGLIFIWVGILHLFLLRGRQKIAFMAIFFLGTCGILNHLINNEHYYRKEYFSFLVVLILVLLRNKINRHFVSGYTLFALVLVITAIFNHESFIFAHAGVLVFLFWNVQANTYQKALATGLIAIAFFATLYFHGDRHTADLIWSSLSEENREVLSTDSAIQAIGWDLEEALGYSLAIFNNFGQLRYWFIAVVLFLVQFVTLSFYLKLTTKQILVFLLFNVGLIPLIFLGRDWGRWLNIATFNLSVIVLQLDAFRSFVQNLSDRTANVFRSRFALREMGFRGTIKNAAHKVNSRIFILVFALFCTFYIPECCMFEARHIISMLVKEPIKLLLGRP